MSACGGSDDPAPVAQEWANATLNHEDKASSLQCRPDINNHGFALIKLTTISLTGFRALDSTQTSSGTWTVTLQTEPTQGATFDVTVVEQHGKYLVCS